MADQALNIVFAAFGLIAALLVMCRVRMVRKPEGSLASLLSYTVRVPVPWSLLYVWVSVSNVPLLT
jgi:hypothetical protein